MERREGQVPKRQSFFKTMLYIPIYFTSVSYTHLKQRATVEALGLKKVNKTVEMPDNDAVRGMIWHVRDVYKRQAKKKAIVQLTQDSADIQIFEGL